MKSIRIYNDIFVNWYITTDGEPLSLEGRELRLYIQDRFGVRYKPIFTVTGNMIAFTFEGQNQKHLGSYTLILQDTSNGMNTIDECEAFELVAHTSQESNEECNCGCLVTHTLQLRTAIQNAIITDAPLDGNSYARKEGDWTPIVTSLDEIKAYLRSGYLGVTLNINVGVSKTTFTNTEDFKTVYQSIQNQDPIPFRICASYASGSKFFFYPTCIKTNYISLHSKAGSSELHIIDEEGHFTRNGELW